MFVVRVFLISCLVLLSVANRSRLTDPIKRWDCQKIPTNHKIHFESGVRSIYRPYYVLKDRNYDDQHTQIPLYDGSNRHCTLIFSKSYNDHEYQAYQVSTTHSYFLYRVKCDNNQVFSVDLSTCSSTNLSETINGKHNSNLNLQKHLIHYEDGFDLIFPDVTNIRLSYDANGNRISQPKVFLLNSTWNNIIAISPNWRNSNLIVDYIEEKNVIVRRFISLVDVDGRLVKPLLQFNSGLWRNNSVDDVRDSLYAHCWQNDDSIECVQFDHLGNEKYRNTTDYCDELVAVCNLKGGGVVLFTATEWRRDPALHAVVMRPGKVTKVSYSVSTAMEGYSDKIHVTDFDEANHQFTIRVKSNKNDVICRNVFSLPTEDDDRSIIDDDQ